MQDNKYLKHDALASMGCKLMFLSEKERLKGYGSYWLLLGTLEKVEGFRVFKKSSLLSTREVKVKENNNNNNKVVAASAFVLDRGWDDPSPMMRHCAPTHLPCGTKSQSCGNDESDGDDAGDENHRSPSLGGRLTEFQVIVHRVWEADSPSFKSSFTEFHSKRTKAFSDWKLKTEYNVS